MPKIIVHLECITPDNDFKNVVEMIHLLDQMPPELRPHYINTAVGIAERLPTEASPIAAMLVIGTLMLSGKTTVITQD